MAAEVAKEEEEKTATNQRWNTAEGSRATRGFVAIFTAIRKQKYHRQLDRTAASSVFPIALFVQKLIYEKVKHYVRPAFLLVLRIWSVLPWNAVINVHFFRITQNVSSERTFLNERIPKLVLSKVSRADRSGMPEDTQLGWNRPVGSYL